MAKLFCQLIFRPFKRQPTVEEINEAVLSFSRQNSQQQPNVHESFPEQESEPELEPPKLEVPTSDFSAVTISTERPAHLSEFAAIPEICASTTVDSGISSNHCSARTSATNLMNFSEPNFEPIQDMIIQAHKILAEEIKRNNELNGTNFSIDSNPEMVEQFFKQFFKNVSDIIR